MTQREVRRGGRRVMHVTVVGLAAWWVLVLASDAEAYIDPSASGMLVQLLLAGTAGVAVLGKLFWVRIKRLFGATNTRSENTSSSNVDRPHDGV